MPSDSGLKKPSRVVCYPNGDIMKILIESSIKRFSAEKLPPSLLRQLEIEVRPKVQGFLDDLVTPKLVSSVMRAQWEKPRLQKVPGKDDSATTSP